MFSKKKVIWLSLTIVVICAIAAAFLYKFVVSGGLIALQKPSVAEAYVADRVLEFSVPKEARLHKNPLSASQANIQAGEHLYQNKCEVCHSADGSGNTSIGDGLYPPPSNLSKQSVGEKNDGEIFYFIRNGIRNTGMPGWHLSDEETWQLVLYIRNLPKTAKVGFQSAPTERKLGSQNSEYVGSASCKQCHADIFEHWGKTRMANVVRNPHQHPDAIIPDLSKPDPLVTFSKNDIDFVYGSRWKQRYFKKVGEDYFPLPAQWDVTHKVWRPYLAKEDWWVAHYPSDNAQRPTGPLCDGCHSVNYNVTTRKVTEWNVGCESCHGAGGEHIRNALSSNVVNPARLDYVQANDTCIRCHSQGRPITNPINGKYYDWPVGYHVGLDLKDYWKLESHKLGETTFTHFADGTAHKNRMQGNDFVGSLMYTHGVTCFTCHDPHGSDQPAMLRKTATALCLDCHGAGSPNGPFGGTIANHTHHKVGSAGSECIACHMPKIAQTIADVNVRSHTFRFIPPAKAEALKIPNACSVCHTDKSVEWATTAMRKWKDRSSWRAGE
jgi:predicted CXXCH cytochrome family protein